MTKSETNLENRRMPFVKHVHDCKTCAHFDHSAKAMANLCWRGTDLFTSMVDAEDEYIKLVYKVSVENSPQTLRSRAKESVL